MLLLVVAIRYMIMCDSASLNLYSACMKLVFRMSNVICIFCSAQEIDLP